MKASGFTVSLETDGILLAGMELRPFLKSNYGNIARIVQWRKCPKSGYLPALGFLVRVLCLAFDPIRRGDGQRLTWSRHDSMGDLRERPTQMPASFDQYRAAGRSGTAGPPCAGRTELGSLSPGVRGRQLRYRGPPSPEAGRGAENPCGEPVLAGRDRPELVCGTGNTAAPPRPISSWPSKATINRIANLDRYVNQKRGDGKSILSLLGALLGGGVGLDCSRKPCEVRS